jgi:hypothetical protein
VSNRGVRLAARFGAPGRGFTLTGTHNGSHGAPLPRYPPHGMGRISTAHSELFVADSPALAVPHLQCGATDPRRRSDRINTTTRLPRTGIALLDVRSNVTPDLRSRSNGRTRYWPSDRVVIGRQTAGKRNLPRSVYQRGNRSGLFRVRLTRAGCPSVTCSTYVGETLRTFESGYPEIPTDPPTRPTRLSSREGGPSSSRRRRTAILHQYERIFEPR